MTEIQKPKAGHLSIRGLSQQCVKALINSCSGFFFSVCWLWPDASVPRAQIPLKPRYQGRSKMLCHLIGCFFCFSNKPTRVTRNLALVQSDAQESLKALTLNQLLVIVLLQTSRTADSSLLRKVPLSNAALQVPHASNFLFVFKSASVFYQESRYPLAYNCVSLILWFSFLFFIFFIFLSGAGKAMDVCNENSLVYILYIIKHCTQYITINRNIRCE